MHALDLELGYLERASSTLDRVYESLERQSASAVVCWEVVQGNAIDPTTGHHRTQAVRFATEAQARDAATLYGGTVEAVCAGDLETYDQCEHCNVDDPHPRAAAYTDCDDCHSKAVLAYHDEVTGDYCPECRRHWEVWRP